MTHYFAEIFKSVATKLVKGRIKNGVVGGFHECSIENVEQVVATFDDFFEQGVRVGDDVVDERSDCVVLAGVWWYGRGWGGQQVAYGNQNAEKSLRIELHQLLGKLCIAQELKQRFFDLLHLGFILSQRLGVVALQVVHKNGVVEQDSGQGGLQPLVGLELVPLGLEYTLENASENEIGLGEEQIEGLDAQLVRSGAQLSEMFEEVAVKAVENEFAVQTGRTWFNMAVEDGQIGVV